MYIIIHALSPLYECIAKLRALYIVRLLSMLTFFAPGLCSNKYNYHAHRENVIAEGKVLCLVMMHSDCMEQGCCRNYCETITNRVM